MVHYCFTNISGNVRGDKTNGDILLDINQLTMVIMEYKGLHIYKYIAIVDIILYSVYIYICIYYNNSCA